MSQKNFDEGMLEAQSKEQFVRLCDHAQDLAETRPSDAERPAFESIVSNTKQLAVYRKDSVHAYWTMENVIHAAPLAICRLILERAVFPINCRVVR